MIRTLTLSASAAALLLGLSGSPLLAQAAQIKDQTPQGDTQPGQPQQDQSQQGTGTETQPGSAPSGDGQATGETVNEAVDSEGDDTPTEQRAADGTAAERPANDLTTAPGTGAVGATRDGETSPPIARIRGAGDGAGVGETPAETAGDAPEAAPEESGASATTEEQDEQVAAGSTDEPEEHTAIEGDHGDEEGGDGHGATAHIENIDFPFDGIFGSFDQMQLQRGLQIYTEVCSACHGLRYVPIRTLSDEGGPHMPEDQIRVYATNFEVFDPALDDTRPATPNDKFPKSNLENAPDLSLIAKARAGFHGPYGTGINQLMKGVGGPEYIVAILTGYTGETKDQAGTTFYENTAFPGGWIAMAPPLAGEDVEFADGHENDVHHEAVDVAAFLMWTAEPKMTARKHAGIAAVLFLGILSVLLFLTNKRIWAPHKAKKHK